MPAGTEGPWMLLIYPRNRPNDMVRLVFKGEARASQMRERVLGHEIVLPGEGDIGTPAVRREGEWVTLHDDIGQTLDLIIEDVQMAILFDVAAQEDGLNAVKVAVKLAAMHLEKDIGMAASNDARLKLATPAPMPPQRQPSALLDRDGPIRRERRDS